MNITKIRLFNFRNYDNINIDHLSNLNLIIGSNGVGKTTILESIYLGSLAKTFKTTNDLLMIKDNKEYAKVNISIYDEYKKDNLEIIISDKGKKTKINDQIQKRLSNFISKYRVILLSPDELKIIKSSPNIRRNYLNIQLSQLHKEYIEILNNYNLLIKNKNDFLKKLMLNRNLDSSYLYILDDKIADYGIKINNYRKEYINKINDKINYYFNAFSKKDNLYIEYKSDFNKKNKDQILKDFKKNRIKDINYGFSDFGIHRDDYEFIHNNKNSKYYSSQGEQKLIILSMKLAEINLFKNNYDIKPVILLDDLFSELDLKNRNKIFDILDNDLQIFITTTDLKNIKKSIINKAKIYNLDERK